jgi:hypothetical protein
VFWGTLPGDDHKRAQASVPEALVLLFFALNGLILHMPLSDQNYPGTADPLGKWSKETVQGFVRRVSI